MFGTIPFLIAACGCFELCGNFQRFQPMVNGSMVAQWLPWYTGLGLILELKLPPARAIGHWPTIGLPLAYRWPTIEP